MNPSKTICTAEIDGTTITMGFGTGSQQGAIILEVEGKEKYDRARRLHKFFHGHLINEGYDIETSTPTLQHGFTQMSFTPQVTHVAFENNEPGSHDLLTRRPDNPVAATEEIRDRLSEMCGLASMHSNLNKPPVGFNAIIKSMQERYPAPRQEVAPEQSLIKTRTTNNVPNRQIALAIYNAATSDAIREKFPTHSGDLSALAQKLASSVNHQQCPIPTNASDQVIRNTVRKAVEDEVRQWKDAPAEMADSIMAEFIREMHVAKRRNPLPNERR